MKRANHDIVKAVQAQASRCDVTPGCVFLAASAEGRQPVLATAANSVLVYPKATAILGRARKQPSKLAHLGAYANLDVDKTGGVRYERP
jgi:hypothetical protein